MPQITQSHILGTARQPWINSSSYQKCSHSWSHSTHHTCLLPLFPLLLTSTLSPAFPSALRSLKKTWPGSWGITRPRARIPSPGPSVFHPPCARQRPEAGVYRCLAQRWTEVTRCPKGIPAWVMGLSPVPDTALET